jgi:hypothetical protein
MLPIVLSGLQLLTKPALVQFSKIAGKSLKVTLPKTLSGLKNWFRKNPTKSSVAVTTLAYVGGEAIGELLKENAASLAAEPLLKKALENVIGTKKEVKSSFPYLKEDDRKSDHSEDKMSEKDLLNSGNHSHIDELITKAINVAGNKHNLLVLRSFLLNVTTENLDAYRSELCLKC